MKVIWIALLFLVNLGAVNAQEVKYEFYSGTVNNRPVRLFLKQDPHPCGGNNYLFSAIYQYGKGKNWIQLSVDQNDKGNFSFIEYKLTGLMMLKKSDHGFEGVWISADAKTQLKVILVKQPLSAAEADQFNRDLDRTNYENNDC